MLSTLRVTRGHTAVYAIGMSTRPIDTLLKWAEEKDWSQSELARQLGVDPANITNWKARGLPPSRHIQVAELFGKSVDELIRPSDVSNLSVGSFRPSDGSLSNVKQLPAKGLDYGSTARAVPVVGRGMGGIPDRIWGDEGRPVGVTDEYALVATQDDHAFLFRVEGDSMSPRFQPGEYGLCEPGTAPEVEDDVLVRLTSGETLLKRLLSRKGGIRLGSWKPGEPTLMYRPDEIVWMYYVAHPVPARKLRTRL